MFAGSVKLKRLSSVAAWSAIGSASVGASLTGVTWVPSGTSPSDQMPVSPNALVRSTAVPAATAPCEPSARRASSAPGVPAQLDWGTKRSQCEAGSTSAAASDKPEVRIACQPSMPFAECCHSPCSGVAALPTMATPARSVRSPASTASLYEPAKSAATVAPVGEAVSSSMVGSVAGPRACGRSFTGLTVSVKLVEALLEPSLAVTVILEVPKPLPESRIASSRLPPLPA